MRVGMTCFIGIPVIIASLVTVPGRAESRDVLGWEGTAWGMTESELTKRMASRGFNLVPGRPRLAGPFVGNIPLQTKADIGGDTYDVAFRFSERTRRLDAVLIGAVADSVDEAAALHDSLLGALTAQYGPPATGATSLDTPAPPTRWIFKTTTVALRLDAGSNGRGRALRQVSIAYLPTTRSAEREADEGVLLLLLMQMLGKGRR